MAGVQHYQLSGVTRIEVLVGVVVLCLIAYLLIPTSGPSRAEAARAACLNNLMQVGQALGSYLKEHEDTWPYVAKLKTFDVHTPPWPMLPSVLSAYTRSEPDVFRCPADHRVLAADSSLTKQFPTKTTWFETEGISYEWMWGEAYGGKKVGQEERSKAGLLGGLERADQPLLADFEAFHAGDQGGAFNTLYADLRARPARPRLKP
jgi:type II secretory pathway pseudopilin PulG